MAQVRVVVPCFDADSTIGSCIAAIAGSGLADAEVVLVDDGRNHTLHSLAAHGLITVMQTPGGRGAGAARNAGSADFTGGVLVFLDADVKVGRDAICRLIEPITTGRADATVGAYSTDTAGRTVPEAYKQLYLAYTYGRRPKTLRNTFWTALGAVRAETFVAAGGFDSHYRGAGPEDIDLGIKLSRMRARIVSVPQAVGVHLASYTVAGLLTNDLRKGCEDIYIHWKRGVPLTDNRHADVNSIAAVLAAWLVLILTFEGAVQHLPGLPLCALGLYLCIRAPLLIGGYLRVNAGIFPAAVPITFVLDLVRGAAVLLGTASAALEEFSGGRWRPFARTREEPEA